MSRVLPILFNTEMVQAIMDGRKTVTRRICKDGNDYVAPDMGFYDADKRTYAVHNYCDKRCTYEYQISTAEKTCPICPGDILYVRETWNWYNECGNKRYIYRADYGKEHKNGYWKPSIHMPKEAARIFLKVKDVRVERLQDITEEQAIKEGCQSGSYESKGVVWGQEDTEEWTATDEFISVWNSTIKKSDIEQYSWSANPWVWVIEFERCEKPEEWK